MKTVGNKKINGDAKFCIFGCYFYYGFGQWHNSYYNATNLQNNTGWKFKKDAINYARVCFKIN